jgi:hypothetical protein
MSINFGVDLRIKEANELTKKLLLKRGFKSFESQDLKKSKVPWIYFRDNFNNFMIF